MQYYIIVMKGISKGNVSFILIIIINILTTILFILFYLV
jgi:hypothetical protein